MVCVRKFACSQGTEASLGLPLPVLFAAWLLTGCATSTIESRRLERPTAYDALSPEQRQLVDQGRIRVGMSEDAVYLAWGPPAEVREADTEDGRVVVWVYRGAWLKETGYWVTPQINPDPRLLVERYRDREYRTQPFVRAEVRFSQGCVIRWRDFPRPPD